MKLTGRTRYRLYKPTFGKPLLVLQVEVAGREYDYAGGYVHGTDVIGWRDALLEDVKIEVAA